jgi:hypothetical protein
VLLRFVPSGTLGADARCATANGNCCQAVRIGCYTQDLTGSPETTDHADSELLTQATGLWSMFVTTGFPHKTVDQPGIFPDTDMLDAAVGNRLLSRGRGHG